MPGMYYDELDGKRRRSNFPNLRNIRNLIIQVFEGGSFDPVLKAQARLSPESKAIGGRDDTCCNVFINCNGSLIGGSNSSDGGAQSSQPQNVHTGVGYNYGDDSLAYRVIPVPVNFLYSPNSTSAQTIKLQMSQTDTTGHNIRINRSESDNNAVWVNRQTSALTVYEVSA